jgi:hypothetical protein
MKRKTGSGASLHSLLWRNTAPSTAHSTGSDDTAFRPRDVIRLRMLCRGRCRQPPARRDSLCIQETLQYIFSDDEQVLHSSEPRIFFRRGAVNIRPTRGIVFNNGGPNFSRGSWRKADHVKKSAGAVDRSCVRCRCSLVETPQDGDRGLMKTDSHNTLALVLSSESSLSLASIWCRI